MHLEWLTIVVIAVSSITHLLSFELCRRLATSVATGAAAPVGFAFYWEAQILIGLSLAASIAGSLLRSRIQFRAVLYVRFCINLIVFQILGIYGIELKILMTCMFLIDAVLYEPVAPGIVTIIVCTSLVAANELVAALSQGEVAPIIHIVAIALSSAVVGGGYSFISYLREKAVVDEQTIRDLNNAFDKLTSSNLGLQSYAANVQTESARDERERITRELHDSVGYALTNIAMLMNASKVLMKAQKRGKLSNLIEHTRETAQACLKDTRSTLYRLRSINEHAPIGLNALSHLARVYSDATGTQVSIEYGNVSQSYGGPIDSAMYRFVQEGLTNAFRHNKAARITIRVTLYEEDEILHIRIWDNGAGASEITEGLGLQGMRERLKEVSGSMKYGNVVDGFVVSAMVPVSGLRQ